MYSKIRTLEFLLLIVFLLYSVGLQAQVSLGYSTNFESSEGYLLNSALSVDWATDSALVAVTDVSAYTDTQSVNLPAASPEHIISLDFDPATETVLFVDYYTRLSLGGGPALPLLTSPATSAFVSIRSVGPQTGEWLFLDGDGAGSGQWQVGDVVYSDVNGLSMWQRVSLRLDLASNLWDVFINGNLAAINLGFAEAMLAGSESLLFYGSDSDDTFFDQFALTLSNPLFVDADSDGIDDQYEAANGLSNALNDRDFDLDGDGLSNLKEFLLGTFSNREDSDGDGLKDGFEVSGAYSPLTNEYASGAFGDQDGDLLANQIERGAYTDEGVANASSTLPSLSHSAAGGHVQIVLIGRGSFSVSESVNLSNLEL
jgi:hypothetical protein